MDTIVGLSTTLSNNAISIIRISGEKSVSIIEKIFKSKSKLESNKIIYGFIEYGGETYDEVLVSYMKAPKSYTGEDVIEINCHGGKLITMKILNLLTTLGLRLSDPGEFTKRAFLNGKIDLTKAESIIDMINAKSELELKCAINQNKGSLYKKLRDVREILINIISKVEVIVDFEDELEDVYIDDIGKELNNILSYIEEILRFKDQGIIIKEGINTSIVGRPNAGKSSLLNALCKKDRAIVTDIEGTTRDIIRESVNFYDIPLNLYDTAGIRESNNIVESIGINMAKDQIKESDLLFFLIDSTKDITEEDIYIFNLIKDKKVIILLNKCDIKGKINEEDVVNALNIDKSINVINISSKEHIGFDKIKDTIKNMFNLGEIDLNNDSVVLTNQRHIEAMNNAKESIKDSINSLHMKMPLDIISIDIRKALTYIMNITGEDVSESIIDNIFSNFCIGK